MRVKVDESMWFRNAKWIDDMLSNGYNEFYKESKGMQTMT